MLKAVQQDPRAEVMQVPMADLGRDLALLLRIGVAKEHVGAITEVLDANETVVLQRISRTVNAGLKLGASVIAADGKLTYILGPALAVRGEPSSAAVASRADNARTDQATRADEQAKIKGQTPSADPPATTVTTSVGLPESSKKK